MMQVCIRPDPLQEQLPAWHGMKGVGTGDRVAGGIFMVNQDGYRRMVKSMVPSEGGRAVTSRCGLENPGNQLRQDVCIFTTV